jgi:hypothetical protein
LIAGIDIFAAGSAGVFSKIARLVSEAGNTAI